MTQEAGALETAARGGSLRSVLLGPIVRFAETELASTWLLLGATILALVWANSPLSDSYFSLWQAEGTVTAGDYSLSMDFRHWVNDGLMAAFFFVIGLEVRYELSVGELRGRHAVIVPFIGAIGGMIVPALLYLLVNPSGDTANGWAIVIGTDTAFLLGALAVVGPRVSTQLRVFLLTMTVIDDLIAVGVIALVYTDDVHLGALLIAAAALGAIGLFGMLGAWRILFYAPLGLVLWLATVEAGVHPSFASMAAGLLVPAHLPRRVDVAVVARLFRAFQQAPTAAVGSAARTGLQRAVSVNERLQILIHPWTAFVIVPVFAFANAGVDLRGGLLGEALRSSLTWGVIVGLVAGKLLGIGLAALGAVRLRLGSLPSGVGPGQALGGAALSGIGFTVSLLIAGLAFDDQTLRDEATVGVLIAAFLSVATGWVVFRLAALRGERTASLPLVLDRPVNIDDDHIRGRFDARLTLVEYSDFECPFCGTPTGVVRELREHLGDRLRYVFRHLPLHEEHPHAQLAAEAAEAAGTQGRFWEMHDLLFEHHDQLEYEDLLGYAGALRLDVEEFARALGEGTHTSRVEADILSAERSGARRTPTFFIGERRYLGSWDAESLLGALTDEDEPEMARQDL